MQASSIHLRAIEPEDIQFLYDLENNRDLWHLSHTQQPFSKHLLMQYIKEADRDIYEAKQFRFAIESRVDGLLGFIDLFDFDPKNRRAGVGIIIKEKNNRRQGYGKKALEEIIDYCFNILFLHQIYANISIDNKASIKLFESVGFEKTGHKKDWNYNGHTFEDELLYQLIHN